MPSDSPTTRAPVIRRPGTGRPYDLARIQATFLADGEETTDGYAISEWWLEPDTAGPGSHQHEEDDVFYVLDGVVSFMVDGEWFDAPKGSLVIAPGGTPHDFENRTNERAGFLNISVPGGFEQQMPGIAAWFRERDAVD